MTAIVALKVRREHVVLPDQQVPQRLLPQRPTEPQQELALVHGRALAHLRMDGQPQHQHAAERADDRLRECRSVDELQKARRRPQQSRELIVLIARSEFRSLGARQRQPDDCDPDNRDLGDATNHPIGMPQPRFGQQIGLKEEALDHTVPIPVEREDTSRWATTAGARVFLASIGRMAG